MALGNQSPGPFSISHPVILQGHWSPQCLTSTYSLGDADRTVIHAEMYNSYTMMITL